MVKLWQEIAINGISGNVRKRFLLISKITLKTSGRRDLTTSYLLEVTVQKYVLDSFS